MKHLAAKEPHIFLLSENRGNNRVKIGLGFNRWKQTTSTQPCSSVNTVSENNVFGVLIPKALMFT